MTAIRIYSSPQHPGRGVGIPFPNFYLKRWILTGALHAGNSLQPALQDGLRAGTAQPAPSVSTPRLPPQGTMSSQPRRQRPSEDGGGPQRAGAALRPFPRAAAPPGSHSLLRAGRPSALPRAPQQRSDARPPAPLRPPSGGAPRGRRSRRGEGSPLPAAPGGSDMAAAAAGREGEGRPVLPGAARRVEPGGPARAGRLPARAN